MATIKRRINRPEPIISKYYKIPRKIMKEASFSIVERILLLGIFNQKDKGMDIETLRAVLDDVKEVSLSEDEKKEINLQEVAGEDGKPSSLKWDKSIEKTISLQDKTVKHVLDFIKSKSDSKELGVADAPLLEIESKLK